MNDQTDQGQKARPLLNDQNRTVAEEQNRPPSSDGFLDDKSESLFDARRRPLMMTIGKLMVSLSVEAGNPRTGIIRLYLYGYARFEDGRKIYRNPDLLSATLGTYWSGH